MEMTTGHFRKRLPLRFSIYLGLAAALLIAGCDLLSPGESGSSAIRYESPDCPAGALRCGDWRWSPDGEEIVYLWWLPYEGSRPRHEFRAVDVSSRKVRTLVEAFDDRRIVLAWIGMQVFGSYLYYSATDETGISDNGCCSGPGRGSDIYRVRIDGGTPERVAQNIGTRYAVSPDGYTLVSKRLTADEHLSRYDIRTRTWSDFPVPLLAGWVNWAPDGSSLAVVDNFAGQSGSAGGQLYDFSTKSVRRWQEPEGVIGNGGSEVSRTIVWDRGEAYLVAVRSPGTVVRRRLRDDTDAVVHTFGPGLHANRLDGLSVSADARFAAMWRTRCPTDGSGCEQGVLELVVVDLQSGGEVVVDIPEDVTRLLARGFRAPFPPVLAPDGCRVAIVSAGLWIRPVPGAC
ncbi:MAG: hypothetical protein BMS9Abin29_2499 [Gemmatimonadota bacterium]|nr:MAG: hypothetical protein BMS9Abin29_2499 [Gemmatimonadota bacterium]